MNGPTQISRRQVLATGSLAPCAGVAAFLQSHAAGADTSATAMKASVQRAGKGAEQRQMHGGRGLLDVTFLFEPERPGRPALFLQYDLPPQTSEGVHIHGLGRPEGAWDEYYYIAAGQGRMRIGDEEVTVGTGDAVHTPLGVPHGIENTSRSERLRVFLVAVDRA